MRIFAKELAGLAPDAILAHTTPVTAALQRETRTITIIFVVVSDPLGEGFVAGLPRPGGNITGFIHTEGDIAGKLLELLTEIAPSVKRVAIMFNPDTAPGRGSYYLPSFETAARSLKLEPIAAPVRNDAEVEAIVAALGREEDGGLVAMPDGFTFVHRAPIIFQTARNKVPACRMPLGQSQDISQANPEGRVTPRFWHHLIRFRHFIGGSLALASLNLACRDHVPTFPQRALDLTITRTDGMSIDGNISKAVTARANILTGAVKLEL